MANQPDKRQQFRFWYPFWGNGPTRTPASRPSPANQAKPQAATPDQPQPIKRTSRTSSLSSSSSPSPSPSPSSSPAKHNQPRRPSRTTPSPLPSPTQSPSRRSPRFDQVKQKTKGESPQMTPSPSRSSSVSEDAEESSKASNQQGTAHEGKMSHHESNERMPQNPKNIDGNPDSKPTSQESKVENENTSKDLDTIEHKSISFDPLSSDMPTKTVIPNQNSSEHKEGPSKNTVEDHEPKTRVQLEENTTEDVSSTQHEENKQTHNEAPKEKSIPEMDHQENEITRDNIKHIMTSPTQAGDLRETIKEVVRTISENPKGTIKDFAAQPSESGNLHDSNYKGKTIASNNNNSSGNRSDHTERENPITKNRKEKEKIDASPSSTRTSFQKNIKDGISKLVQKINTDNAFNTGSERATSIITLAGENKGASMYIGHESERHSNNSIFTGKARKLDESAGRTSNTGKESIEDEKESKVAANVNSNVQSINNSMLQESRCDTRDPGVHLRVSSRMKKEKLKKREGQPAS